jgi:predicted lipid-binding transport protein (Tim44 family)
MNKDEALKLALEALERCVATCFDQYAHNQVMSRPEHFVNQTITAIREALALPVQQEAADELERLAQPVQEPVSAAEIQRLRFLVDSKNLDKLYRDLHLVEEICEFYAKCDLSVEALRDWVSERMDTPPLPVQEPVADSIRARG